MENPQDCQSVSQQNLTASATSSQLTFQWGCGNYSGFGDGGAWDNDGIGDNIPISILHPCEYSNLQLNCTRITIVNSDANDWTDEANGSRVGLVASFQ